MGVSLISNPPYNMKWQIPQLAGFMPQYMGYTIPPKNKKSSALTDRGRKLRGTTSVYLYFTVEASQRLTTLFAVSGEPVLPYCYFKKATPGGISADFPTALHQPAALCGKITEPYLVSSSRLFDYGCTLTLLVVKVNRNFQKNSLF